MAWFVNTFSLVVVICLKSFRYILVIVIFAHSYIVKYVHENITF